MKALFSLVLLVAVSVAESQYRCVVLPKPDPQLSSYALGISLGRVVGHYRNRTYGYNAVYWYNGELFELNPSNANQAIARGVLGDQIVGNAGGGPYRESAAVAWNAGAPLLANLHVGKFQLTHAYATNGSIQVGGGFDPGARALLWKGTSESCVDITPEGYRSAAAEAISNVWIGGVALKDDDVGGATIWPVVDDGAGSPILIAPEGFPQSGVSGVSDSDQVGYGKRQGSPWWEALRWTGSASSVQFLHPVGATYSQALATNGKVQVGFARFPGQDRRAALWKGTRESWLDLHRFLPVLPFGKAPSYSTSEATGVDEHGNICGFAAPSFGPTDAVMWVPIKGTWRW